MANFLLIEPGNRFAVQSSPLLGSQPQFDMLLLSDRYEYSGKGRWRCVNAGLAARGCVGMY